MNVAYYVNINWVCCWIKVNACNYISPFPEITFMVTNKNRHCWKRSLQRKLSLATVHDRLIDKPWCFCLSACHLQSDALSTIRILHISLMSSPSLTFHSFLKLPFQIRGKVSGTSFESEAVWSCTIGIHCVPSL